MKFLTPSRVVAVVAVAAAALSVAVAPAWTGSGGQGGDHPQSGGHHGGKKCSKRAVERNKRNVVAYYETAFNDKNPRLAVQKYGGPEYIQHNPLAGNGFDAFIAFVEGFVGQYPDVHVDIRRVIAECDLVVTHSLFTGAEPVYSALGTKGVDIFRVNREGKVVEHWDVLAPISAESANGNPEV